MGTLFDEIIQNARSGTGACTGCPATSTTRADGESLSEGVNPGLGHRDASVMFVTIEPSPAHGESIKWDAYDWAGYNNHYYEQLVDSWSSGEAIQSIIDPIEKTSIEDVWVADSVKCPPRRNEDDQARSEEFSHCQQYLWSEIRTVDPEVIVGLGNRAVTRTLDVLDGPRVKMGTATYAGRRFNTDPPLVVSPSWSYGWLFDRTPQDHWGGDWMNKQQELQGKEWSSYLHIVQTALRHHLE
jgi:uracil-DNA glycosylase